MNKKRKICLVVPIYANFVCFRKNLVEHLQQNNYEVSVVLFEEKDIKYNYENIKFYTISDSHRGINPFKVLSLKHKYKKVLKEIKPDVVFTFTTKPNIFAVFASKECGIKNIYTFCEGIGDVYTQKGLLWNVIKMFCFYYTKKALDCVNKVFFYNNASIEFYRNNKMIDENKIVKTSGSTLDFNKFNFSPIKTNNSFLMMARMIKTKGVFDYCKVAEKIKSKYPNVEFNYIGSESDIKIKDIQKYIDNKIINYYGFQSDVQQFLQNCSVNVLPSNGEGFGMSIAEAGLVGRMTIGYNTYGVNEIVKNNQTGFLVEANDLDALYEKIVFCIENPDIVKSMGDAARKFVLDSFNPDKANSKIVEIVNENWR